MALSRFSRLLSIFVLVVGVASTACSKKQKPDEQPVPSSSASAEEGMGDSDSGKAFGLRSINFPYDSFVITDDAKSGLMANAQILKDKASVKIQIEGHCDVRGGIQYNLALGEKRANAAKKFLIAQGISESRIATISYGKERLMDQGTSEAAHAKNRRANFVLTAK